MAEPGIAVARCEACGEALADDGAPCEVCCAAPLERAIEAAASEVGLINDLPPEECASGPLWVRISAATVYAIIGLLCGLGALSFFMEKTVVVSDVVFGAMAAGLMVIAIFGVKESLFPSDWRPE